MTPHDARLLPAAGAAWLASAAAWLEWPYATLVVAMAVVVVGLHLRRSRQAAMLAMVAGFAAWLSAGAAVAAAMPVRQAVGERVELAATAASDAVPGTAGPTQDLWRVELSVHRVDGVPARARVVVWGGHEWASIARGEALRVVAQLAAADGGDAAVAWRPQIEARAGPRGLDAAVAQLRAGLRDSTAGLPERLRPLTRGMVIGDDSGMAQAQRDQLSRAGLTHLTAVSGSHFAIVLVAVAGALRAMVRSRRTVAVVTAVAMGGLVCLVFPDPSVVRAATMAGAVCAALWWGRPAHALPALCAGIVAVSIVDPRLACEPGFVMSAAAVAAIALWAPALAVRLQVLAPPVLAHPLAVCIAAQAAVMPVLCLIGGAVGPWAVAANLAVGWCAAPVTLVGLAGVVAEPACPTLAHLLAMTAGWCAWPVDAAAKVASSLPGADAQVPLGVGGAVASGAILAVAVALTFAVRLRLGRLAASAAVAVLVLAVPLAPRILAPGPPGDWLVVACDVGQGDAMLLRSGERSAVMIDVGPPDGLGSACLERYGVARIDLLVITHPHADHEGALPQVVTDFPIAQAWISPAESEHPTASTRALERAGVPISVVHTGDEAVVGDVTLTVLAPSSDAVDEGSTGLNDASVVTLASVSGVTVLGLGDLEHEGQRGLAARLAAVPVDVVKVPHHGSDRQEPMLADLVSARLGIVSVGAHNTYGHPAPDALALWGERVGVLARTDRCGDVVIVDGPAIATSCPTDVGG